MLVMAAPGATARRSGRQRQLPARYREDEEELLQETPRRVRRPGRGAAEVGPDAAVSGAGGGGGAAEGQRTPRLNAAQCFEREDATVASPKLTPPSLMQSRRAEDSPLQYGTPPTTPTMPRVTQVTPGPSTSSYPGLESGPTPAPSPGLLGAGSPFSRTPAPSPGLLEATQARSPFSPRLQHHEATPTAPTVDLVSSASTPGLGGDTLEPPPAQLPLDHADQVPGPGPGPELHPEHDGAAPRLDEEEAGTQPTQLPDEEALPDLNTIFRTPKATFLARWLASPTK